MLNEIYWDPQRMNPGMVKNNRVKDKGSLAKLYGTGKDFRNDSALDVIEKHSGGKNAKYGILGLYLSAKGGNADAAREFFRAINYIPKIDDGFREVIHDNTNDAKKKKNADAFDYL